jgi:hypothetical protein
MSNGRQRGGLFQQCSLLSATLWVPMHITLHVHDHFQYISISFISSISKYPYLSHSGGEDGELHSGKNVIVGSWVRIGFVCQIWRPRIVVVVLVRIRSKEKGTYIVSGRTLSAFFCDNSLVCNLSQVSAARYLNGQNKRTPAFKSLSYHISA